MEQKEELLARARKLYGAKQFEEVLHLLSDERLEVLKDAALYKLKGLALRRHKGIGRPRKKVVLEAIQAFTKSIKLDKNDPESYSERGAAWRAMRDFKKALKDHNTAIKMSPKDSRFFRARADTKRGQKNLSGAMKDISIAIDLNRKEPRSYILRSEILRDLRKFKKARRDLTTAIRLNPKDPRAYYRRSTLWRMFHDKSHEIADLAKALEVDREARPDRYVDLGDLYYARRKYDLAFRHYNTALDMDLSVDLYEVDHTLVNIFNVLAPLKPNQRKRIYEACVPISDQLLKIRDSADPAFTDDFRSLREPVVHFTKLPVSDILLSDDGNKFRFYNVSYMNDPEEGKILLQILNDQVIEESYNDGGLNEESNFYLGSFLPASHADELVMWRTYGKDEHDSEGKGCSILIDRGFFEQDYDALPATPKEQAGSKTDGEDAKRQPRTRYDTTLHRVIYYNKARNEILHDDNGEIRKQLMKLRTQLKDLIDRFKESGPKAENSRLNRAIDSIVYYVITELRYYFKSSDYSYENEERVILFVPPKSPLVKIEEGSTLPRRLYVEAQNPIRKHIGKIVLGPRVVHPDRWSYLKVRMIKDKNEIEIVKSSCKFQ